MVTEWLFRSGNGFAAAPRAALPRGARAALLWRGRAMKGKGGGGPEARRG